MTRGAAVAPASWGLGEGQAIPWEYAPAPEARDVVTLRDRYGLFIDGRDVEASDGGTFTSIDPSTELPLALVSKATAADIDRAVRAARRAGRRSWTDLPGRERAKYLFRIARILQERSREFAVLESMDSGKPIKESRDVDVPLAAAHFWYYAGWADKLEYAFPGRVARPLGVAAQIIPWNFPLLMLAWKIAPALAAGNTVVLKPASTTPLTALLFAEVCRQADLPPGVVNIVPGPGEIGMALVTHKDVAKVAFTGSTEIGKKIHRAIAGTDKAITLELGGKAANIVFEDAALDQAVEGIVNGIYFNQGEVCCAGSRLLVQESVADEIVDRLKTRLSTLRVGDPLDKNTDVGAINSRSQLEKITELVASGVAEGADLYQPACDLPERGYFFRPTLFTNVAQSYRVAKEEIFGPVLSVLTFRTPDEAVEKANNTAYGLSAGIWTEKAVEGVRDGPGDEGGRRVGEHVQPLRPDGPVRRLQGVGVRARGRHARAARVRQPGGPLMASRALVRPSPAAADADRLPVLKTYKLYLGGQFPRTESGRSYLVSAADGAPLANACRASRKDVRDAVRFARGAAAGWAARTAMNRGQVLYRVAELMEGRFDQFTAEVAAAEGITVAAARTARRALDRPLGLVRGLGGQDRAGPRVGEPGRGAVLQFHGARADGGRGARCPGAVVAARPGLTAGPRARRRQRRGRARVGGAAAARDHAGRGARDVRRAGRRRQHPHRDIARSSCRSWRRTWTSTGSMGSGSPTTCGSRRRSRPPTP